MATDADPRCRRLTTRANRPGAIGAAAELVEVGAIGAAGKLAGVLLVGVGMIEVGALVAG